MAARSLGKHSSGNKCSRASSGPLRFLTISTSSSCLRSPILTKIQVPRAVGLECSCDRQRFITAAAQLSSKCWSPAKVTQTRRKIFAILSAIQGPSSGSTLLKSVLNKEHFCLRQKIKKSECCKKASKTSSAAKACPLLIVNG